MKIYWRPRWRGRSPFLKEMPLVKTKRVRISLHRLEWDTRENIVHDHGCDFFSVILRGSYIEEIHPDRADYHTIEVKRRRWLSAHILRNTQPHRLLKNQARTVTLFVTFNHLGRGPWAYLPDGSTEDFATVMIRMRDRGELSEM